MQCSPVEHRVEKILQWERVEHSLHVARPITSQSIHESAKETTIANLRDVDEGLS